MYNNLAFFGVFIQDLLWGNWVMFVYYQYYLTFYINYDIKYIAVLGRIKNQKMKTDPVINVNVGDLIRVKFLNQTESILVSVTEVERRYGRICNRTRKQNPLVVGFNVDNNESEQFDSSFVTEIMKRRNSRVVYPKKNIFSDYSSNRHCVVKKGGRWTGTLRALAVEALAELPYEFDRPLHESRLSNLYNKSGIGFKESNYPFITVDRYRFCWWVSKNYTRIVMTSKEYSEEFEKDDEYYDLMMNQLDDSK